MLDLFYNFHGLNEKLFLLINNITNVGILPHLLQIFSWSFFILNGVVYYLALCTYCYINLKKIQDPKERRHEFWLCYYKLVNIGIIYAIFVFTYTALKFYTNFPRPFCAMKVGDFITICAPNINDCLSSFPSAHTGMSVIIAYMIWPYLHNNIVKIITCLIVISVGISRITLAMHYPADIIYSVLIATLIIIAGNRIHRLLANKITRTIGTYLYHIVLPT